MCRPFGPAIIAASLASSSERATMPICCTNDSRPFLVASMATSSGSISCCIATLIATGVSSCFRPLPAALFFMAAPLPLGALRPGRPDSQAGRGAAATSRFQRGPGHSLTPPVQHALRADISEREPSAIQDAVERLYFALRLVRVVRVRSAARGLRGYECDEGPSYSVLGPRIRGPLAEPGAVHPVAG